jgi:alpha-1,2-mannosyltransferase
MVQAWDVLRRGDWLTRERIRLVAAAILVASIAGSFYLVVTAHGLIDSQGRPLGTDFSNVYAAGTYVLDSDPDAPFDPSRQHAREQEIFGAATPFYGWHYPPFFLFVAAALALMPYGLALAVWQALTLGLYLLAIRAILLMSLRRARLSSTGPLAAAMATYDWLLLALAFPAVLINFGHGQNGFLTAALLAAALVKLERRPLIAGVLFGLLAYKPQFGLLIDCIGGRRSLARLRRGGSDGRLARRRDDFRLRCAGVAGVSRFDPLYPPRRARTGRYRLVAGTRSRASSHGRGCGAPRFQSPTLCKVR